MSSNFKQLLPKLLTYSIQLTFYCKLSFENLNNEYIKTGTARSRFLSLINIILDQKELKVNNKSPPFFSVKTMNSKKRGLYTHILNAVLSYRTQEAKFKSSSQLCEVVNYESIMNSLQNRFCLQTFFFFYCIGGYICDFSRFHVVGSQLYTSCQVFVMFYTERTDHPVFPQNVNTDYVV